MSVFVEKSVHNVEFIFAVQRWFVLTRSYNLRKPCRRCFICTNLGRWLFSECD